MDWIPYILRKFFYIEAFFISNAYEWNNFYPDVCLSTTTKV